MAPKKNYLRTVKRWHALLHKRLKVSPSFPDEYFKITQPAGRRHLLWPVLRTLRLKFT